MFNTKQSIEEEEKNKNSEKINKIDRKKERNRFRKNFSITLFWKNEFLVFVT